VLFDSGIRTGSDIIKALSLGAQAILRECPRFFPSCESWEKISSPLVHLSSSLNLVGRPWVYGLAVGGQVGVEEVIKCTLADLDITMGLCGYARVGEIIGKSDAIAIKQKL